MSTNDGGPAFPGYQRKTVNKEGRWIDEWPHVGGMSLRDYFAGQALAGMLAYSSPANNNPSRAAEWAYQHADAMLAEREKVSA